VKHVRHSQVLYINKDNPAKTNSAFSSRKDLLPYL
jgi:hypothetical protein